MLSYPLLNNKDEKKLKDFLNTIDIIELNNAIKEKTIELRKKYKLKLPDAIIYATAYFENAVLLTNDINLKRIKEIKIL